MKIEDTSGQDEVITPHKSNKNRLYLVGLVLLIVTVGYYISPALKAWSHSGASVPIERLRIATVDEQRNGTRMPPLCADDFYNLCGKSLLNAVEASWHGGQQLNLTLNRRTDWVVSLIKDS